MLSIVNEEKLRLILARMLDEDEKPATRRSSRRRKE